MPLTNIESSRVFELCGGGQAGRHKWGVRGGAVGGFSLDQLTMLWSSGHHIALSLFITHMWLLRLFKVM